MRSMPKKSLAFLLLGALCTGGLLTSGVGCVKENVDQKAREFQHIKKDLSKAKDNLKTGVQEQAERAKAGMAKLNEKLPELREEAREGLETAKEGLLHTRDKVVDTVKETLHVANEKVDETVEKAREAGE